jgi:hypothetical protein
MSFYTNNQSRRQPNNQFSNPGQHTRNAIDPVYQTSNLQYGNFYNGSSNLVNRNQNNSQYE